MTSTSSDPIETEDGKPPKLLVIDVDGTDRSQDWSKYESGQEQEADGGVKVCVVDDGEAIRALEEGEAIALVVFAQETNETLLSVLRTYRGSVGALTAFQAIVCEDPSPRFMAEVFEYGIEQFIPADNWGGELAAFARSVGDTLSDEHSSERNALKLMRYIKSGDQSKLEELKEKLGDEAHYDFLASYSLGRAHEATGQFSEAIAAFRNSTEMNKIFRPSKTSLGENLLVTGQLDEAEKVFRKMEQSNPCDSDRKLLLAAIATEKGDFDTAKQLMAEAATLSPGNPKLDEAKAHIHLKSGNVNEAFKLLDNLKEVGPFFAAKLNEMGIRLSQAGKGKSALALYQKAHKVVRADLRYKISMNAALACHRMGSFDLALRYLKRCEKEYGSKFEKLEKIRGAVAKAMKKNQAA